MILSFAPLLIQKYVTSASIWVNSGGKICLSGYLFAEKGVCGNENGRGGIDILMDGCQVSPLQIVTAYMTKEEGTYMRDYVMDVDGNIESLAFTDVNGNYNYSGQAENTP